MVDGETNSPRKRCEPVDLALNGVESVIFESLERLNSGTFYAGARNAALNTNYDGTTPLVITSKLPAAEEAVDGIGCVIGEVVDDPTLSVIEPLLSAPPASDVGTDM